MPQLNIRFEDHGKDCVFLNMSDPLIIQGGMGAGVSNWSLAKAVSQMGQLGVVSGTALDSILIRRLQQGDPGDHIKRALNAFPKPEIAWPIYQKYYVQNGKPADKAFKLGPVFTLKPSKLLLQITVLANFVEVFLAKEGHSGIVGINYLEKIQMPNLASIYGAMLAGVDYILMGAGIPREIPGIIDRYVNHDEASMRIDVEGSDSKNPYHMHFNPIDVMGEMQEKLKRPRFLAIVSSYTLALSLKRKSTGKVDGFVVEGHTAGGHNAPPRGGIHLDPKGEPIYGDRDAIDFEAFRKLELPFWPAGSYGEPEKVEYALNQGATGVQIGSPFAFCDESGLSESIKRKVIEGVLNNDYSVFTDPLASPTGFPFKVFLMGDTLSETSSYEERPRICDLGYLRKVCQSESGKVLYRCPSEPVDDYTRKGGNLEETQGRKCLCNALLANIGLEQQQKSGYMEKPLVTSGRDLSLITQFIPKGKQSYSAADVLSRLLTPLNLSKSIA